MSGHAKGPTRVVMVHPPLVRVVHWLNVIAIFIMVGSGWRIYDNVPIFHWLTFPIWLSIGGDPEITYRHNGDTGFSNALLWHFAAMWLLVLNGLVYLAYGIAAGRFRMKLFPLSPRAVLRDMIAAATFKLDHDDISKYNAVQKLLYLGVLCILALVVISGLAIWKPVQFWWLTNLLGGFQGARLVHFLCMSAIVAFVVIHVSLAILVPSTIKAMITGKARVPADTPPRAAE
ncbi:MAG TPA: cytochrome b/b6 domain-containing protein [Stellaceae bacterium]|nr:cytochrome b/b6 domain-containing protein [Stellaceae bacterium]